MLTSSIPTVLGNLTGLQDIDLGKSINTQIY